MSGTCPDAHLVFLSCTVKTIGETQITLYIRFSCAKLTPKGLEHLRSSVYLLAATLPSGAFLLASEEARFEASKGPFTGPFSSTISGFESLSMIARGDTVLYLQWA